MQAPALKLSFHTSNLQKGRESETEREREREYDWESC